MAYSSSCIYRFFFSFKKAICSSYVKNPFFFIFLPPLYFPKNNERPPQEPSGLRASQVSVVRSLGTVYPQQPLLSRKNLPLLFYEQHVFFMHLTVFPDSCKEHPYLNTSQQLQYNTHYCVFCNFEHFSCDIFLDIRILMPERAKVDGRHFQSFSTLGTQNKDGIRTKKTNDLEEKLLSWMENTPSQLKSKYTSYSAGRRQKKKAVVQQIHSHAPLKRWL